MIIQVKCNVCGVPVSFEWGKSSLNKQQKFTCIRCVKEKS